VSEDLEDLEREFEEETFKNFVNDKLEFTIDEFKDILEYMKKLKNVSYSLEKINELEEIIKELDEKILKMDENVSLKWKIIKNLYEIIYKNFAKRGTEDSLGLDLKYLILMADIYDSDLINAKNELEEIIKEIS
jgi:carboxypeptidase C (cathepsin A)